MIPSRFRNIPLIVVPLLILILLNYLFWFRKDTPPEEGYLQPQNTTTPNPPGCPALPGIHDILVVLKTGATEARQKVPVHFNTTLKCIPNFVLFSDFEEEIAGVPALDVLRSVDENIKQTQAEFDLYNRLRESGRAGLTAEDINDDPSTPSGKPDNRGWLLDKWKFLPMINETLNIRADAKWYVFIEADTYVVWPNLLAWLDKFDPSQPYYMGSGVNILDITFGHGGSGLVLSHAAIHKVSDYRASRVKEYDDFTAGSWAGDCVLGKALKDAGVGLFFSNPMLQGDTPWTFSHYGPKNNNHHWCTPVVTYHHMTPDDIRETWAFEQSWWANTQRQILLHADMFQEFVRPQIGQMRDDWDNASSDENVKAAGSREDCHAQCEQDHQCHQYSYEPGRCLTSKVAMRGSSKVGMGSGWMTERINKTMNSLGSCRQVKWITPR
ncbi:hypothetical protein BDV26DRAFT_263274 [Aspergillus bertholletiae]|uniref:N-acetylgalactosaminide beta-1,3-galactosyltransferase n=1 Tax=Aspergillus bertholletiae TaxID=1226010 RepID=A0A5N7B7C3_9EURO|nr:hypothetical protein BDV26DRAFT_263274 [Aspergillus bertholletiae]